MIPHTSEDYTIDECKRQAKELRESGKYSKVVIRRKQPEDGKEYGRVYVELKPACRDIVTA